MPYLQTTQDPDILAALEPVSAAGTEQDDGIQLHLFPELVIVLDDSSVAPPPEMTGMYYLG